MKYVKNLVKNKSNNNYETLKTKLDEMENNLWKHFYYVFTLCDDQTIDNIFYSDNTSTKEFGLEFY